jgi:glucosamine kinase
MTKSTRPLEAPSWFLGIDGGGTGTRARLQSADGRTLGHGQAGPSGLSQGIEQAWRHVEQAIAQAFASAALPLAPPGDCALGLGLAGAGRPDLRQAFLDANPGYVCVALESDACTLTLGAHPDRTGIVVAAGTGSVGAARHADGAIRLASGWGYPVGDEGGGAWLGLHAVSHAQAALDGRRPADGLSRAVLAQTGLTAEALQAWCAAAGQQAYASLAPQVFEAAALGDAAAAALLQAAADELALLAQALQPAGAGWPIVLAGSVGTRLRSRWPVELQAGCVEPRGDSADGALHLIRTALAGPAHDPRPVVSR